MLGCPQAAQELVSSPPAILWATSAGTLGDAGSTWPLVPGKAGTPVRTCTPPHTHGAPLGPSGPPALPWQQPHLLLPAALHPGSVIQHGGRWWGGVGRGPSRAPLSPCVPTVVPGLGEPPALSWRVSGRHWAAPSLAPSLASHADAPLSLRCVISSDAPVQHPLRESRYPQASRGGAGSGAWGPGGISPVAPHPLLQRGSTHALLLASFNVSINPRAGVGAGVPAQCSGFWQAVGTPGVLARLGKDPPRRGRWPRHAKHHAPGHPCPRCHTNGSMVAASTPPAGLATGTLPWRPRTQHGLQTPAEGRGPLGSVLSPQDGKGSSD